jgi:hypothetical protein
MRLWIRWSMLFGGKVCCGDARADPRLPAGRCPCAGNLTFPDPSKSGGCTERGFTQMLQHLDVAPERRGDRLLTWKVYGHQTDIEEASETLEELGAVWAAAKKIWRGMLSVLMLVFLLACIHSTKWPSPQPVASPADRFRFALFCDLDYNTRSRDPSKQQRPT